MKFFRSVIQKLFTLYIFIILLVSCAASKVQTQDEKHSVDMTSYSVNVPPGGDWQMGINKEKEIVTFQRPKKWWTGQVLGSTLIQIFRDEVSPQGWLRSEEDIADDVRNDEERMMREEGVNKGVYQLLDVKKNIEAINGMKLYTMYYVVDAELPGGFAKHGMNAHRHQEAMLYLYIPPDFKEKHVLFRFLINEDCQRGSLGCRADLTQIHAVINSFRVKGTVTK